MPVPTPTTNADDGWTITSGSHPSFQALKQEGVTPPASDVHPDANKNVVTEEKLKAARDKAQADADAAAAGTATVAGESETGADASASAGTETDQTVSPAATGERDAHGRYIKGKAPKANKVDLAQARIDQLTKERGEVDRREQDTRRENDRLKAELEALKKAPVAAAPPAAAVAALPAVATGTAADKKAKPVWGGPAGYEAAGKSWEEYEADKDEWIRADAREEAGRVAAESLKKSRDEDSAHRTTAENDARVAAAVAAHQTRVEQATAKHPDFAKVINDNLTDITSDFIKHLIVNTGEGAEWMYHLAHHRQEAEIINDFKPTRPIVDALLRSKNLTKVMSHFAAHPEEFDAIRSMDAIDAIASVARVDQRVGGAPAGTPAPRAHVSAAAPPVRPVTGAAPVASVTSKRAPTSIADFSDLPLDQYVASANRFERTRAAGR